LENNCAADVLLFPGVAEQYFFDPLTDPSLHINVFPWQWEMPPLEPEHG
jgi:hypothetical protein